MVEFVARPREVIRAQIEGVDVNIDYSQFFGDQHDLHRAKMTTDTLLNKVTHGETIKAEYSNPLGHKAVESYEVPATWAISYALDELQGNIPLSGKTVKKSVKDNAHHRAIEKSSSMTITPIRKEGKRLVVEKAQDGETHIRVIWWAAEQKAQNWISAEREYIKGGQNRI